MVMVSDIPQYFRLQTRSHQNFLLRSSPSQSLHRNQVPASTKLIDDYYIVVGTYYDPLSFNSQTCVYVQVSYYLQFNGTFDADYLFVRFL